jgi:hypothetical protein
MSIEELAEHFDTNIQYMLLKLYGAELIYLPEIAYAKPTEKALVDLVCEVKDGRYYWNANELFWIKKGK